MSQNQEALDQRGSHWLLFDAECPFCRWSVRQVLAWDRRRKLTPLALQHRKAKELLSEIDEHARMRSWHLVAPNGRVWSAGDAVAPLMNLLPWGRPFALFAKTFPNLTEGAYQWVARHREALASLLRIGP